MVKELTCPICGKYNEYWSYSECGFGTVEQHYFCPRCTYFVEQVYSPVCVGISADYPEEYLRRVEELELDVYEPEEWD